MRSLQWQAFPRQQRQKRLFNSVLFLIIINQMAIAFRTVNVLLGVGAVTPSLSPSGAAAVTALIASSSNQQTTDENNLFQIESATVAFVLTILMSVGIGLNVVLLLIVILHPRVRQLVNAFIGHYAAISVLKCIFCIVFATSLTTRFEAALCDKIGGSYVVLTSVEVFNLLAMVCAEAYFFGQANVGRDGRGSCCCVLIGLFLIYLGSVILHLGPTIIAGGIGFNRTAGSCIFGFKSIQSYVAHAIWIVITTLGIAAVLYYLSVVYREVQACRPHRIASLVRASVPTTTRNQTTVDQLTVKRIVADSQRRAVVLILVTCTFVITSYPLFLLTLFDLGFSVEGSIYRVFTFFSWTNTLINPILFLLVDRKFGLIRLLKPCGRYSQDNDASLTSSLMGPRASFVDSGQNVIVNTTQPISSTASRSNTIPPSIGGGSTTAVNERTGLISKSNERLQYELRDDDDVHLGCGGGLGANRNAAAKYHNVPAGQSPQVLHDWQNRVGGRLFLQGELGDADNNDDSVMMVDGPSTVILYDRLNAPSSSAAERQQPPIIRSNVRLVGDSPTRSPPSPPSPPRRIISSNNKVAVPLAPCLSTGSLTGGQTVTPSPGRHAYLLRNMNNVPGSPGRGETGHHPYSNVGMVISNIGVSSANNRTYSNVLQHRNSVQRIGNSPSNDNLFSGMVSSPSMPQPIRIYRPQSVIAAVDASGRSVVTSATTSPSTMMLLAQQRQLQQQQLQQQKQQSVQLPTLRVVANSSNISFRGVNNKQNSSITAANNVNNSRTALTTTASFIGTEDSLEEIIYSNNDNNNGTTTTTTNKPANSSSSSNNFIIKSNSRDNDDDRIDDEETTC